MQKVLLISGCKQSGKSSAMNYLAGYMLKQAGLSLNGNPISMFQLDEEGGLEVDQIFVNPETGEKEGQWAKLDIARKDVEFVRTAQRYIWPIVRANYFADALKDIACSIFGLKWEEVYGTDEQKNRLTHITWESIYKLLPALKKKREPKFKSKEELEEFERTKPIYLTNREFLEMFGTEICRTLYDDCWIQHIFNLIAREDYPFVVIPDCRFETEIEYARKLEGIDVKVVRLTRRPYESDSKAETDLLNYNDFDAVIDNTNMSQDEKGVELIKILRNWGWIV